MLTEQVKMKKKDNDKIKKSVQTSSACGWSHGFREFHQKLIGSSTHRIQLVNQIS